MNWEIEIDIYTLLILCLSVKSLQSFLTLWDPMDCSLPGSSVRGEFSRQEYWSGLPCLSPGDVPNPGIDPRSPALQADSLSAEPPGKFRNTGVGILIPSPGIFPVQESNWGLLQYLTLSLLK